MQPRAAIYNKIVPAVLDRFSSIAIKAHEFGFSLPFWLTTVLRFHLLVKWNSAQEHANLEMEHTRIACLNILTQFDRSSLLLDNLEEEELCSLERLHQLCRVIVLVRGKEKFKVWMFTSSNAIRACLDEWVGSSVCSILWTLLDSVGLTQSLKSVRRQASQQLKMGLHLYLLWTLYVCFCISQI